MGALSEVEKRRRDCVELESMASKGGMTERGNDCRWTTPQITGVPRVYQTLKLDGRGTSGERHSPFSNQDLPR